MINEIRGGTYIIFSILKREKAITIVELMISLALLSIVLAVVFSFYFFVSKSSTIATKQTTLQVNVLSAREQIKDIVLSANSDADNMKIYEDKTSVEEVYSDEDVAIYTENDSVISYDGADSTILEGNDDINYEITFEVVDEYFLKYTIKGVMGGQTYEMSSIIKLSFTLEEPTITGKAIIFHISSATV